MEESQIIKSPIAVSFCQYPIKETEHCTVALKDDILLVCTRDGRVKVAIDPNQPIKVLVEHFNWINAALYPI